MRIRLGIAVSAERLRFVAIRGTRVVVAIERPLDPSDQLSAELTEGIAALGLPRMPQPRVTVALGPARAQTRLISGLPAVSDARLLGQALREGVGTFFVGGGASLEATDVRVVEPGTVWASAFDALSMRSIEQGCAAAGLRVHRFVPAVVALGQAAIDDRVMWHDGDLVAEVRLDSGRFESVRRRHSAPGEVQVACAVREELAVLGPDGWRFADAYGAALLPNDEPMQLRPAGVSAPLARGRLIAAGLTFSLGVCWFLIAPSLRASHYEAQATERLAALREERRSAALAETELAGVTETLVQAARLTERRYSPTLLLSEITGLLPEGSALLTIRMDTGGVSLAALTPLATSVVQPLERVSGAISPELIGAVVRESHGGIELERVSVRFGIDARRRAVTAAADAP